MKEKESKYFMAGTDEEVLIGDVINVELEKDFEDGRTLKRGVEFKLTEETIPLALEMGIIEEGDDEEENDDLIDFHEEDYVSKEKFHEFTKCVSEDIEDLSDTASSLEKRNAKLEEKVATLIELYKLQQPSKKSDKASPKKK